MCLEVPIAQSISWRWQKRRSVLAPFIVIVGPDGVGKTSVARAIARACDGEAAYVHFRPPLTGNLPTEPPNDPGPPPAKLRGDGNRAVGWLRLLRSTVAFSLGYWTSVRRAQRTGALVVGDRWMYGYIAQPRALRYYGPQWLARLAIRAVPRPDLVANLVAKPKTVRSRKQDLTLEEIREELDAWSRLPDQRVVSFAAEADAVSVAAAILGVVGKD